MSNLSASTVTAKLSNTKGRFVGIVTRTSKGVTNTYNAQILGQSAQFVTVRDRNRKSNFKLSKSSIIALTGV